MELNLEEQGPPHSRRRLGLHSPGMNYSFRKVSENTEILEVHMPKPTVHNPKTAGIKESENFDQKKKIH